MKLVISAGPTSETVLVMYSRNDKVVFCEEYNHEARLVDVMRDVRATLSARGLTESNPLFT
jgi:hypothetical protein